MAKRLSKQQNNAKNNRAASQLPCYFFARQLALTPSLFYILMIAIILYNRTFTIRKELPLWVSVHSATFPESALPALTRGLPAVSWHSNAASNHPHSWNSNAVIAPFARTPTAFFSMHWIFNPLKAFTELLWRVTRWMHRMYQKGSWINRPWALFIVSSLLTSTLVPSHKRKLTLIDYFPL